MLLLLSGDTRLIGEPLNYVLQKKKINKSTKEIQWSSTYFYPTIEYALEQYFNEALVKKTTNGTVADLIAKIREVKDEMLLAVVEYN